MQRSIAAWALGLSLLAAPAFAQIDEIVVTGSRMSDYDANQTPQVTFIKRADNLLTKATVICDTRDESQRRQELRSTLRNMIRAASQDHRITLGVGEEVIGAFDESMIDKVIEPDKKADTSRATVLIKTAVTPGDTFDAATARIKTFAEKTPKVGRTEILLNDDWELSIVNPNQYRPQVAKLAAEDARQMASLFGADYGVEITGLQLPVSWYQSGPLDLALYVPYKLTVRPKAP